MAIEGAQRCADLTNRLLTFSRRQPLQTSVVDLQDLMPGLLELMRRTLGERIEVDLKAEDGLWPSRSTGRSSRRHSSISPSMPATPCRTGAV